MIRLVALALLAVAAPASAAERAPVQFIYGTQSGLPALDSDPFGGNPFATAVIAALEDHIGDAGDVIIEQTLENSGNFQAPDVDSIGDASSLRPATGETAKALVIVFADYGDDSGLVSLPGAAFDAARVSKALRAAGFDTVMHVATSAEEFRAAVAEFGKGTNAADHAVIYTTSHGSEVDGRIVMLPPELDTMPAPSMPEDFIMLSELESALQARSSNRLFYAGCRDNPLQLEWPE